MTVWTRSSRLGWSLEELMEFGSPAFGFHFGTYSCLSGFVFSLVFIYVHNCGDLSPVLSRFDNKLVGRMKSLFGYVNI